MARQHPILAALLSANAQWSKDVEDAEPEFFTKAAQGQSPKVLWIGCADSRVPETVITATRPGDIFVHRNIANQFHADDTSAQAVLQYAVENLEVEHVVIVGHTQCGGAYACIAAARASSSGELLPVPTRPASDPINAWLMPMACLAGSLDFATDEGHKLLVEENVKAQVKNVSESATMKTAWKEGKNVWVHGWVFEIEQGRLRDLGISIGHND